MENSDYKTWKSQSVSLGKHFLDSVSYPSTHPEKVQKAGTATTASEKQVADTWGISLEASLAFAMGVRIG